MDVVVYTAHIGTRDRIHPRSPAVDDKTRLVLFTDAHQVPVPGWEVYPLHSPAGLDARRSARWHKLHPHVLFPGSITMWHDATMTVRGSHYRKAMQEVAALVFPFATFRHPQRSCVYQEIDACIRLRKDSATTLGKQREHYQQAQCPSNLGLFETRGVICGPTDEVIALNEAWWQQLEAWSCRDQVSLPFVAWRQQRMADIFVLPGKTTRLPWLVYRPHQIVRSKSKPKFKT